MGKCVVVVKSENGRITAAFNEDGFTSVPESTSPNRNGFIISVDDDRCGEIFHRNDQEEGIWNHPEIGPDFGNVDLSDLHISNNCNQNARSGGLLGVSYGRRGSGLNETTLFGQQEVRVVDYEVFKIVIE
jgi:hypothetical protein